MLSNMDWKCPECGRCFTNREAWCENWRDPERKFGCPDCHTFFRIRTVGAHWRERAYQLLTAVLLVTCTTMLSRAFRDDDMFYIVNASLVLALVCLQLVVHTAGWKAQGSAMLMLEKIETAGNDPAAKEAGQPTLQSGE